VQSLNEAAALMLGGTMSELHKQEIRIDEWDIRSPQGDVVLSSDFSRMHREDSPWCQPIDIRFRNRRGRSVCCRVSLRKDMTVRDPLAPQIVVLMHELPGYDGINDGSNDADLRALMRQIQSTLDDLQIAKGVLDPPRDPATFGLLSAREREVLDYLLDGVRVSTIADRLYLSQHTVRNHLRSIFKKLGVNSQAEVIRLARGMN
jgi:DNA-binding CsgD family transcriptional regulator